MAPPKRVQISSNEGSILLAISAIRSGAVDSVLAAAKMYSVPRSTLRRRYQGMPSREDYTPKNSSLTLVEEGVILDNILKLDSQGLSPTIDVVRSMADSMCKAKGKPNVGRHWPTRFIQRNPSIIVKSGRTYECQRKLCETPAVIQAWFELVKNTINKHGILPEDMYNFDETGFQLGQISTSRVVTSSERTGRPKQIKPSNTEWVTVIQGACADGSAIPPLLIFKGKTINYSWLGEDFPQTWMFAASS
jgi:hypothetical protein